MQPFRPLCRAAVAGALALVLASPVAVLAREGGDSCDRHHHLDPEQRARFAGKHLDREAAMLEIKASQQAAWDAYAAARLDLMASFDHARPPADADAASLAHRRAEQASALAARLNALADATDKLQAVLGDDQRKVLDRIAHMHPHDRFGDDRRDRRPDAARPSAKAPAKAKD